MNIKNLSHKDIKYIRSLANKKYRQKHGSFIVEGTKSVLEFMNSEYITELICVTPDWLDNNSIALDESKLLLTSNLEQISMLKNSPGILAVLRQKENLKFKKQKGVNLILDNLNDPGNLGTIIRTADWFGLNQIICSLNSVDCYNPKVIQSSMGSLSRVDVVYSDLVKLVSNQNLPVYGADISGKSYRDLNLPNEYFLIIGNESNGISPTLRAIINEYVTINKIGKAESLNAAISAAILLANTT